MSSKPYTVDEVRDILDKLSKRWPYGYSLFSWSGSLHLMDDDKMQDGDQYAGSAYDAIVDTFPGIPNDGGDPD